TGRHAVTARPQPGLELSSRWQPKAVVWKYLGHWPLASGIHQSKHASHRLHADHEPHTGAALADMGGTQDRAPVTNLRLPDEPFLREPTRCRGRHDILAHGVCSYLFKAQRAPAFRPGVNGPLPSLCDRPPGTGVRERRDGGTSARTQLIGPQGKISSR